jgi:hypothetical protein
MRFRASYAADGMILSSINGNESNVGLYNVNMGRRHVNMTSR